MAFVLNFQMWATTFFVFALLDSVNILQKAGRSAKKGRWRKSAVFQYLIKKEWSWNLPRLQTKKNCFVAASDPSVTKRILTCLDESKNVERSWKVASVFQMWAQPVANALQCCVHQCLWEGGVGRNARRSLSKNLYSSACFSQCDAECTSSLIEDGGRYLKH